MVSSPSVEAAPRAVSTAEAQRSRQLLLCQAGGILCGLALQHVIETLRPLRVEPVSATQPFVLGLSVVRGHPLPVVSLARLLGSASEPSAARWVVLRAQERRVALSVERVVGVRSLTAGAVADLPPLLGSARAEVITAVGALDARLLVVLESARILLESTWATLGKAGEQV